MIAWWICDGLGSCGRTVLLLLIIPALQCIFLSLNSTSMVLLNCVELVGFKGFELGFYVSSVHYFVVFHGRVGPRRIRRLGSDILLVVYIYVYIWCVIMQLTLVLQVAVVCFCVILLIVCFVSDID